MKTRIAVLTLVLLLIACSNAYFQSVPEDLSEVNIKVSAPGLYEIEVFGDGHVTFADTSCVTGEGETTSFLSEGVLKSIVKSFYENGFFGFEESYSSDELDQWITKLTFSIQDNSKTVQDYGRSAPDGFFRIESLIFDSIGIRDRVSRIIQATGIGWTPSCY